MSRDLARRKSNLTYFCSRTWPITASSPGPTPTADATVDRAWLNPDPRELKKLAMVLVFVCFGTSIYLGGSC